jgi:signal transduction histidine kinase
MDKPAKADLGGLFSSKGVESKEKYVRFEQLSEKITWLAVIIGALVVQLPFGQDLNKEAIYLLCFLILASAFVWYRLLPKRLIGLNKTFIYTLVTVVLIAFLVYNTGGVTGYTIFLFFLPAITAAMSMPSAYTLAVTLFIVALIFGEAFLAQGSRASNFSLATLHSWALFLLVFYSRAEAGEASLAKEREGKAILEKEKTLGELKDEFVFIISHKLKQPATAISGYLEAISAKYSRSLNPEAKKILELTKVNSGRLSKLLDDLLDVSRIEQGSLRVEVTDVFIKPIINEVLSSLFFEARNKKISLSQKGDLDIAVKADTDRLKEVLTNLINNAIKYTLEGGQVGVEVRNEGEFARVIVSDNGIGISEEDQKHLFEKFYRIQNEQTKVIKGSGLGLFITRQLVEKMGGEVSVASKVGQGTSMYFTLPHW